MTKDVNTLPAKYAPVAPISVLKELFERDVGALGSYHLLLAQDVIANPVRYEHLFLTCMEGDYEKFIILDNGAAEGEAVKPKPLLEAARLVKADLVCIPDCLKHKKETLKVAKKFKPHWQQFDARGSTRLMAIPQGGTLTEVLECAEELQHMFGTDIDCWGVPRWIDNQGEGEGEYEGFSRESITKLLMRDYPQTAVHWLGFSDNPLGDLMGVHRTGAMGIDSGYPVALGHFKIPFEGASLVERNPLARMEALWSVESGDHTYLQKYQIVANLRKVRQHLESFARFFRHND